MLRRKVAKLGVGGAQTRDGKQRGPIHRRRKQPKRFRKVPKLFRKEPSGPAVADAPAAAVAWAAPLRFLPGPGSSERLTRPSAGTPHRPRRAPPPGPARPGSVRLPARPPGRMIKLFSLKQQKKEEESAGGTKGSSKKASAAQLRIQKGTARPGPARPPLP